MKLADKAREEKDHSDYGLGDSVGAQVGSGVIGGVAVQVGSGVIVGVAVVVGVGEGGAEVNLKIMTPLPPAPPLQLPNISAGPPPPPPLPKQ